MTFSSDQRGVLKRAINLPRNIATMLDAFSERMTDDEKLDPHFSYLVNFAPVLSNRPGSADEIIEFSKATPEQAGTFTYIKEVDKVKYRPGQIVSMMQKEGYKGFKIQNHTDFWKSLHAKTPRLGFGSPMYGKEGWGWNEFWVKRVRQHCEENAQKYGKKRTTVAGG